MPAVTVRGEGAGAPVSRWARNADVTLHYLDARPSAPGRAVLFVPGFGEEAADHHHLLRTLAPRRAVAVDLRGRGPSSVPAGGYRLEDHVADLTAVVAAAGLRRPHLVTYSRGTTYGLGWAFSGVGLVSSITIGDYPPAQLLPPADLPAITSGRVWRGRPMTDRMPAGAMAAMVADATAVDFWADLAATSAPVLVIRGDRGGMIDDATEAAYRRCRPGLRLATFVGSGHDLWSPDPDRFASTVISFLDDVEALTSGALL